MPSRTALRRRCGDRGAAAVEFALVLTPMLYLIFGGMSYAYMFSFRQALSQAASEGARAAVGAFATVGTPCSPTGPFTSSCPAQLAASEAVASALDTYGRACSVKDLTCTIKVGVKGTGVNDVPSCATGHTCISVQVSYPYRSKNLLPTVPGMGFILPKDLTFASVVQLT